MVNIDDGKIFLDGHGHEVNFVFLLNNCSANKSCFIIWIYITWLNLLGIIIFIY